MSILSRILLTCTFKNSPKRMQADHRQCQAEPSCNELSSTSTSTTTITTFLRTNNKECVQHTDIYAYALKADPHVHIQSGETGESSSSSGVGSRRLCLLYPNPCSAKTICTPALSNKIRPTLDTAVNPSPK